jgi:hypothetical protein
MTLFGDAGARNLVLGMISVFIAIGIILIGYGGLVAKPSGDQIVFDMTLEQFTSTTLTIWFGILLFGVWSGFEIGRYVQTESTRRRISSTSKS